MAVSALAAVVPTLAIPTTQAPEILYLNFSNGQEDVVRAAVDQADQNRSEIGAARGYPAFEWERFGPKGASRDDVVQTVAALVDQAFAPYNILIATARPTAPGYSMVMIGGGPAIFDFPPQVAGAAPLDCDNRQASNVAFAFSANLGSVQALWVAIAQEAAHTLGLEHSGDDRDVMYPKISPTQMGFLDEEAPIVIPLCGPLVQNSSQKLLAALGAWAGGEKPNLGDDLGGDAAAGPPPGAGAGGGMSDPSGGGCAVAGAAVTGGETDRVPAASLAVLVLFCDLCLRKRSRPHINTGPEAKNMSKKGIHPQYKPSVITCACGHKTETFSTRGTFMVEICSNCHPFYTGKQKFVDAAGRIERFQKKYAKTTPPTPTPAAS